MHQASGRSLYGFMLALVTAVLWGMLPIALKHLLVDLTANTITWIRFLVAALFVSVVLWQQKALPTVRGLSRKASILLTIAIGGLMAESVQTIEDKVPIFGDLPLVGRLFTTKASKPVSTAIIFLVHVELLDPTGRPYRNR